MDIKEILSMVDHTYLKQDATWNDIKKTCDEGIKYNVASVCIPPCFVKRAKEYVCDKIKVCTVIGFPNGYSSTMSKLHETNDALDNGADEIDMVINIGDLKSGNYEDVEGEIRLLKNACGDKILKVIIEACLLTDVEKIRMCKIVTNAEADFIKTSTGFSTSGATFGDVELFKKHIGPNVKIKAAGGISSIDDAKKFIELGATRLGTSRIIKILQNEEKKDGNATY